MSQVSKHKADHRYIHKGFTSLGEALIVLAQATLTVQPRYGTLHHPPTRQHHKALLTFRFLHYLQLPPQHTLRPLHQPSLDTLHQPISASIDKSATSVGTQAS